MTTIRDRIPASNGQLAMTAVGAAGGSAVGLTARALTNHSRSGEAIARASHQAEVVAIKLRGVGVAAAAGAVLGGGAALAGSLLIDEGDRSERSTYPLTVAAAVVAGVSTIATLALRRLPHTDGGTKVANFVQEGLGWTVPTSGLITSLALASDSKARS